MLPIGHGNSKADSLLELLEVETPEDISEMVSLAVAVPDGKHFSITVPWGVAPREPLELWFDALEGTLSVSHRGVQHPQSWQTPAVASSWCSCSPEEPTVARR